MGLKELYELDTKLIPVKQVDEVAAEPSKRNSFTRRQRPTYTRKRVGSGLVITHSDLEIAGKQHIFSSFKCDVT